MLEENEKIEEIKERVNYLYDEAKKDKRQEHENEYYQYYFHGKEKGLKQIMDIIKDVEEDE